MAREQSRGSAGRGQGRDARPRKRRCLLKGCGLWFAPDDHRRRYCSLACTAAAAAWSRRRARESYRKSPKGRARRRQQCRSRRRREKEEGPRRGRQENSGPAACEGHQREDFPGFLCGRPGCYERVVCEGRSCQRRYCTRACWRALRTVLEREARWLQRLRGRRLAGGRQSVHEWTMSPESRCGRRLR